MQQFIDQIIALLLLIFVWLMRASLGPTWTKILIVVALLISLADYVFLGRKNKRQKK
ncbi:hypothetical protein FC75_GL001035 [Lacticaseibacillus camelliae DSM 22697 = JCM 13995]|uniref:Uncharacterized protein n=1 Tax=Lacticaseibacillus camelliae DSM 22697 = JCM 13995 TaxID=1423730 RepID=A0A0R2F9W0_9LACO|nr:hypothetical protein FC75_GL001035 [Lacticaseibacillus camelliae DSM 22697 = JCM 13995]